MPRVALLIETSREYGRGLLRGIVRYQHEHGPWSLLIVPRGLGEPVPPWVRRWTGDGLLVRANAWPLARAVLRTGVPAVDLSTALPDLPLPSVGIDCRAATGLAFRHLYEKGFRSFGFCGLPAGERGWSDVRQDEF